MAGSYNHVITDDGNLAGPSRVCGMLECSSGDVFEAVEEMYGMIWWLANRTPDDVSSLAPEDLVELARQHYTVGLELAKANKNKAKYRGD